MRSTAAACPFPSRAPGDGRESLRSVSLCHLLAAGQVSAGLARAAKEGLLKPHAFEAADAHGNTLLSEAAAGGAEGVVGIPIG